MAARLQERHLRRTALLLAVVAALGWGLGLGPVLTQGLRTRAPAELALLLRLALVGLALLIPIAGIYSLVTQYAFWEGWLDGLPTPAELFPATAAGGGSPRCIVYLDGIHQSAGEHPPAIRAFLDRLEGRLPADIALLRGLETYTVMPVALRDDLGSRWFWTRVFALQEGRTNPLVQTLCAALVQANNVIKVGISSDRRYGPILNYELALKICLRLAETGFRPGSGNALWLLGYSGGGEMAMGVADYLVRLTGAPVRIITLCGVFSANQALDGVRAITTVVGTSDPVAALGRLAYPGRLAWMRGSPWNRAVRRGVVRRRVIAGMGHNGRQGPFSEPCRDAVVEQLISALESG
ncbi:MAG: alpha/beta hydrolase [Cyanobacteriota bacterium]|nr:alpha/beta hydrolase [Cyanobacteriota bacterium]